jgi:murein DD-endopeptidase MepM/ murein hydrolase activator NlpD
MPPKKSIRKQLVYQHNRGFGLRSSATLFRMPFAYTSRKEIANYRFHFLAAISCVLLLAICTHAAPRHEGVEWQVTVRPRQLLNGSPFLISVKAPEKLDSLSGTWLDHQVDFSWDAASKSWFTIAGIGLSTSPGTYTLQLNGSGKKKDVSFDRQLRVFAGKYPTSVLSVDKKFTEPSQEQLDEIHKDKAIKQAAFAQLTPQREWHGSFHAPVVARTSDVFGSTRTFNGKVQSTHEGLDFAVPTGTPVSALNRGTVILARSLYFEGGFVVIDHGQGLMTLYLHLSKINVKEGEEVKTGQIIGESGGTGRATGPHLHLAVRWQGVYLNPATLLSLKLP